ncbi:hypothetical protein GCM10009527_055520 [Actinomadura nitritigenes]|uniref:Uncharacterized protein n=1 Tax=Actinomadura nitritigenes TaxID=134602 RepID=A0ABS3RCN8_9ACTN|nr:hypothetical protein [Actinomadura nitritigenes]MBO2443349.1 hypothetical protein [Actinomadura nitritigenes]
MPDNTEPGRPAVRDLVSTRNCKAHRLAAWTFAALAALAALAAVLASTVPRRRRGTRHRPSERRFPRPGPRSG